jgi:hypothetical protein
VSEPDPILAGDARIVLPEAFVADVMIVDPPYRAHVHENATSQDQHTDGNVRHNDFGFASLTEELRTWICQLAARTRRWSLIYTDVESVAKWKDTLELAGATYIRTLPWVRWSMPCLAGDRPPQGFECIVVAYGSARGRKRWNGAGNLTHLAHVFAELDWNKPDDLLAHLGAEDSDWDEIGNLTHLMHLALRGKDKFKTEKPLDQLLDLVSWFSDRDEMVVDPTSGFGTTGLACKILGRRFVGCELNAEWWEKSNARIRSCNPGDLPGSLSPRDSERFLRWVTTSEKERTDSVERKFNTDRVRKRMEDKKRALVLTQRTHDCVYGENKELCVICGGIMPPPEEVDVTKWAIKSVDILFGAQTQNGKVETMMIPTTWTEAYQRCFVGDPQVVAATGLGHCGSTACLLRPLQTDERETACGCGCPPCSALSAHLRPLPGGGRTDGAGAPEPAAPPAAMARPPLTSATERTVPLFDPPFEDEYTAKKWREAYERCLRELAPPLSPTLLARVAVRMTEEKKNASIETATTNMANGSTVSTPVTGDGAELRCPLCIDEPQRCQACRDFLELPEWARAKVPFTGRVAPGEAIHNPRMFMKDEVPAPVAADPPAALQEKRGKGRPAGSKNKAPKEWKAAYTRVMSELGAS